MSNTGIVLKFKSQFALGTFEFLNLQKIFILFELSVESNLYIDRISDFIFVIYLYEENKKVKNRKTKISVYPKKKTRMRNTSLHIHFHWVVYQDFSLEQSC